MSFRMIASDFAIDLGTSNILVYKKGEGLIASEPCFLLLDENNSKVLAIGEEAKAMLGKTHEKIHIVRPIRDGVITDFNLTEALLNYFFKKVNGGFSFLQPRVVICVPSSITDIQARAVEDAALHAGSRDVILVDQTLAAAYGMDLNPDEPRGIFMLNLGAGVSEASVVSLNGIITTKNLNKAGDYIDDAIVEFIRNKFSLEIGKNTAEVLKKNLISLKVSDKNNTMKVDGRDLETAMPKTIEVKSKDLVECVMPFANDICELIYEVLEKIPPEISSDIKRDGIFLTGGLARLKGLVEYISDTTGLRVNISEDPLTDPIKGAGIILDNPERFVKYRK